MMLWIADHVWQSSLIALVIALLTLVLKNNGAHIRYLLWLAASIKFLVPVSALMLVGSQIQWMPVKNDRLAELGQWLESTVEPASAIWRAEVPQRQPQIGEAVDPSPPRSTPALSPNPSATAPAPWNSAPMLPWIVGLIWLLGASVVLAVWFVRWSRTRALVANGRPLADRHGIRFPVPVVESSTSAGPGIVGVLRPVLLLPNGITGHLSKAQLSAVLAHELAHWRRRDNLTAAIHMSVEVLFWFHPLVWWMGARLAEERERACDEAALKLGETPDVYAEGIINVCQYYMAPPLRCASAINGGNLRRRIEAIVSRLETEALSKSKKLLLATFAGAVIAGPIFLGGFNSGKDSSLISIASAQDLQSTSAREAAPSLVIPPPPPQDGGNWRASPAVQSLYQQARLEGQVTILAFDRRDINWLTEAFPAAFPGITVTPNPILGDIPSLLARQNELGPHFDVVSTPLVEGYAMAELGLLEPVDWSVFNIPADRVGLDGTFAYGTNAAYTVAFDLRRVNPADVPSTWNELLEPRFQDVLATNDFIVPRLAGGLGLVWGEAEAMRFVRELLNTQNPTYRRGDAALIFLDEDRPQPWFVGMPNFATELWVRAGLPVDYVIPDPVIMEQYGSMVLKSASHPAAARLLAGWLVTPEGLAARERFTERTSLLPGSNNKTALEIHSRDAEIIYDTPENVARRTELMDDARRQAVVRSPLEQVLDRLFTILD